MEGRRQLAQQWETVFDDIYRQRMADMPLCNSALRVEALGFQPWNDYYLGVLITPWFMNLILVPMQADALETLRVGDKQNHCLPSGRYEFVVGEEASLGRYLHCSLFSPMFEFSDPAMALEVAGHSLAAVLDEENQDSVSDHAQEIERLWHGESVSDEDSAEMIATGPGIETASDGQVESIPSSEPAAAISRRDFLRGRRPSVSGTVDGD